MRDWDRHQGFLNDETLFLLVDFCSDTQVNSYAAYLHDAIILYALALNESTNQNGSFIDPKNITKAMIGKQFDGKVMCA